MNAQDGRKKLGDAERAGNMALRQALEELLEIWTDNPEELAAMADFCEERAYEEFGREDTSRQGTWMFLYDRVCGYARLHMDPENWHRFLKAKSDCIPAWYP